MQRGTHSRKPALALNGCDVFYQCCTLTIHSSRAAIASRSKQEQKLDTSCSMKYDAVPSRCTAFNTSSLIAQFSTSSCTPAGMPGDSLYWAVLPAGSNGGSLPNVCGEATPKGQNLPTGPPRFVSMQHRHPFGNRAEARDDVTMAKCKQKKLWTGTPQKNTQTPQ